MPVAALPETLSDLKCSNETLISLSVICAGLLSEVMSSDVMYLAMGRAEDDAKMAGINPEEFNRVKKIILLHWQHQRTKNPLSGLYD